MRPPTVILSPMQLRVLRIIADAEPTASRGPTIRAIATALGGRAINSVVEHLEALERKGYIVRPLNTLTDQARGFLEIGGEWTDQFPPVGDGHWYKILEWYEGKWIFGYMDNGPSVTAEDWTGIALVWSRPEIIPAFPVGPE